MSYIEEDMQKYQQIYFQKIKENERLLVENNKLIEELESFRKNSNQILYIIEKQDASIIESKISKDEISGIIIEKYNTLRSCYIDLQNSYNMLIESNKKYNDKLKENHIEELKQYQKQIDDVNNKSFIKRVFNK